MRGAEWQRVKVKATECSRIPASFLEEERLALPRSWYEQEYECQFSEITGAVFAAEDISAAFDNNVRPLPRPPEVDRILGGIQ